MPGDATPESGWAAFLNTSSTSCSGLGDPKQSERLECISAGIGERVCDVVEHGIKERLYFQRVVVPGMNSYNGELVKVLRSKYSPVQTELRAIDRSEARPFPFSASHPRAQRRAVSTSRQR